MRSIASVSLSVSLCLCFFPVRAVVFESLDLETSFLDYRRRVLSSRALADLTLKCTCCRKRLVSEVSEKRSCKHLLS